MGRWRAADEFGSPFLELLRPVSPVAIVPLVLIWFGIDEAAKYFLIGYAAVIIVLINTAFGMHSMPLIRERAATCLGASERQIFLHVVPGCWPRARSGVGQWSPTAGSWLTLLARPAAPLGCLRFRTAPGPERRAGRATGPGRR